MTAPSDGLSPVFGSKTRETKDSGRGFSAAPPNTCLALTMGDPAGIGGEIALKARAALPDGPVFFAIDDPERLRALGACVIEIADPAEAPGAYPQGLPVLPERLAAPVTPGVPDPANAPAVIRSIERAVAFAQSGAVSGVVTNPINKKALYDGAGFAYPGHTEFLAALGGVPRTVMMLAAPVLRVVPVTIHIPLAEVPAACTFDALTETIRITHAALRRDFGISAPRIAVSGLNPHAGEGGAMGREEIETIIPALAALRAEGIDATGPLPADTMFHDAARAGYDVAICMYHDQALIPLKALDFARGVNITLGLPFIRTSPDHGTAYNIAGTGTADPDSLISAIRRAAEMSEARYGP